MASCGVAVVLVALLGSACAKPPTVDLARMPRPERVFVVTKDRSTFTVWSIRNERAVAIGGAIGGLIVYGIASALTRSFADQLASGEAARTTTTPMDRLKERLVAALAADPKFAGAQWVPVPDADAVPRGALALTVELEKWGVTSFPEDLDVYGPGVEATAKLRQDDETLWKAECRPTAGRDAMPFTEAGLRTETERLRAVMARTTDACSDELIARFAGPTTRIEKVRREKVSLADVDRLLADLVAGPKRFEAHFVALALAPADLVALRKVVHRSLTALPGSELKLAGTFDGRPFESKMERSDSGRIRVMFSGMRFATEADAEAFLSDLAGPRFRKVELAGEAGGKPLAIRRELKLE
jgi:hypothetical protein